MRYAFLFLILIIFSYQNVSGQRNDNVINAIKLGDSLQFKDAIGLLKKEIKINPNNADAFYWLGRFSHYLVYDSRPFDNKGDDWSKNQVLYNFIKATKLNPNYGDAYYFIAVEYGSRARESIQNNNIQQAKKELLNAKNFGGFPNYILEYARNILRTCDKNAILFTNQDPAVNALMYVQLIEGYRKDISVVCVNLLERPFYIKYMRDGIPNEITKVPISWNNNIIMNMYNYFPWKSQNISIKISAKQKRLYNLPDSTKEIKMLVKDKWENTMWIGTAAILNLIEKNEFERPIYCAMPYQDDMFEFTDFLKNEGFVSKFMPYKVKGTENEYDNTKIESSLLNENCYKDFSDIIIHSQPRPNYFFVDNKRNLILNYVEFLLISNNSKDALRVYSKMKILMPENIAPLSKELVERCKKIEIKLNKNN